MAAATPDRRPERAHDQAGRAGEEGEGQQLEPGLGHATLA